jgi:fatty acid desaturase
VTRTIDRRLIEVNAHGAHNGHVPVTAINSVIGLIVADANGLGPVVLSNERSSNVGNITWLGRDVNHQWSKSISYETLLRDTLSQYGFNPDRYFSLLRPLSESEIADRFKKSPQYFRDFISCNRPFAIDSGRRGATWCGHCPKCLFVYGLMAVSIFFGRFDLWFFGWLLPMWFADMLGTYLFYVQHNFPEAHIASREHWTFSKAALESSSYLMMGPVMNFFTANIGFHHVHHLNAAIPFYRLPEAMAAIPELQQPGRSTLKPSDISAAFALKVWDAEADKMVPFPSA